MEKFLFTLICRQTGEDQNIVCCEKCAENMPAAEAGRVEIRDADPEIACEFCHQKTAKRYDHKLPNGRVVGVTVPAPELGQELCENCDFISIPKWNVEHAMVVGWRPPVSGNAGAIEVQVQAEPEGPVSEWISLEPAEFSIL